MKFTAMQTVFAKLTGNEFVVLGAASAPISWEFPNGEIVTNPQPAYRVRNVKDGYISTLPEDAFATEKPASKPRFAARCPICGGAMTRNDSFMDASGYYRHEGC